MTIEADSQETNEQTQEQLDAAEAAAFESGFANARGDEPPTEEATPTASEPPQDAPKEDEPEAPKIVLAGMTEEQLISALAKANQVDEIRAESEQRVRQVFGKLGEVNALVQELKAKQQEARQGLKLDASKLSNLSAEYPELAEMLAKDLAGMVGSSTEASPQIDPTLIDKIVSDRLKTVESEIERKLEMRALSRQHKDWETVVASPEFNLWKANVLPKEQAATLEESWDAEFVAEKLTEFKAWKDKAGQARQEKQKRLEAAVTPTGDARPEAQINDDDAFVSGWKSARGVA